MSDPSSASADQPLTPRICVERRFSADISCSICRVVRPVNWSARAWRLHLDADVRRMWETMTFRCGKCGALAASLSVNEMVVGIYRPVLQLQRPSGWALNVILDRITAARAAEARGIQDDRVRLELQLVAHRIATFEAFRLAVKVEDARRARPAERP